MNTKIVLPDFGDSWLDGLTDKYIIIALDRSTPELTMFWKRNAYGYTCSLLNAGIFSKETIEVSLTYYNDGIDSVAVPCTEAALATLNLYNVLADYTVLKAFLNKEVAESRE